MRTKEHVTEESGDKIELLGNLKQQKVMLKTLKEIIN